MYNILTDDIQKYQCLVRIDFEIYKCHHINIFVVIHFSMNYEFYEVFWQEF